MYDIPDKNRDREFLCTYNFRGHIRGYNRFLESMCKSIIEDL